MKILHTADWHIGKRLAGKSLIEDQEYVLEQIVSYIENGDIDVVVIAGDLYDRVTPSQSAMNTVNKYLEKINIDLKKPILLISGNHDGKPYIDGNSEWYKHTELFVNTNLKHSFNKVTIDEVDFYLLPYIDVAEARAFYEDKDIVTFEHAYKRILDDIKLGLDRDKTNILVGHLFVRGGTESDSEEKKSVGLMEEVSLSMFKDFTYTLLGHLHHPFAINDKNVHYSGSLLKYSFDEWKQQKGFKVIDTKNDTVEFIPFRFLREVRFVEASYKDIIESRIDVGDKEAYYKFVLSDMESATEPMANLKSLFPNTLVLQRKTEVTEFDLNSVNVSNQSDIEILTSFMEKFLERKPSEYEENKFNTVMKEVMNETD